MHLAGIALQQNKLVDNILRAILNLEHQTWLFAGSEL